VTRNALVGVALLVLTAVGLGVGFARLAPGSDAITWALCALAAVAGAGAFALLARLGRRGVLLGPGRWGLLLALFPALFVDRLPERWQLAALALAAGYVGGFVLLVGRRIARARR
jgi:hypothetical protein